MAHMPPGSPESAMNSRNHHVQVQEIKSQDPVECTKIIAAKTFQSQGHDLTNNLESYAARAQPNQRLGKAFGIKNSFVTPDREGSQKFRALVEKKLHVKEDKWNAFAAAARSIAQEQVSGEEESRSLFDVVQMLSIKMVRKVIWDVDQEEKGIDDQLRILAREINKQWLKSKKYDDEFVQAGDGVEMPDELKHALMQVFGWDGEDRKENPLNFILPGYETIWRVVLRCFIELSARHHPNSSGWVTALKDFLNNPTPEQLEHRTDVNGDQVSALMISRDSSSLSANETRLPSISGRGWNGILHGG